MDIELKWAIQESLRLSSAQQEAALAIPGAHIESGVVVPPDVGDASPLTILEAEYANSSRADLWASKLRALSSRYQAMRRVRGDGNCFYRSLWMGYMERLLGQPVEVQRHFYDELVPMLTLTMAAELPDEARRQEFVRLGELFADSARRVCVGSSGECALVQAARKADESRELLRWLRLLTSAQIRSERFKYELLTHTPNLWSSHVFILPRFHALT